MKYMIEEFLKFHKRGCPANVGSDRTCGLFTARAELESIKAAQQGVDATVSSCGICGADRGIIYVCPNCDQ